MPRLTQSRSRDWLTRVVRRRPSPAKRRSAKPKTETRKSLSLKSLSLKSFMQTIERDRNQAAKAWNEDPERDSPPDAS